MFACSRIADQCASSSDRRMQDALFAEAMQLCQRDRSNMAKVIRNAAAKLASDDCAARINILRLLTYLSKEDGASQEIRQYAQQIIQCLTWRGAPHPTLGYSIYNELYETAQILIDSIRNAPVAAPTNAFTASILPSDSIGDIPTRQTTAQIFREEELPKVLAPIQSVTVTGSADTFKKSYYQNEVRQAEMSKPRTFTMQDQNKPGETARVIEPGHEVANQSLIDESEPDTKIYIHESRSDTKEVVKKAHLTAAKKFMKASSGKAIATEAEMEGMKKNITQESINEFAEGIQSQDWKAKVRAIQGLMIAGEVFSVESIRRFKDEINSLTGAPQASLRNISEKFIQKCGDASIMAS